MLNVETSVYLTREDVEEAVIRSVYTGPGDTPIVELCDRGLLLVARQGHPLAELLHRLADRIAEHERAREARLAGNHPPVTDRLDLGPDDQGVR